MLEKKNFFSLEVRVVCAGASPVFGFCVLDGSCIDVAGLLLCCVVGVMAVVVCAVASGSWALVTVLASCVVFASLVCFFIVLVVVGLLVDDLLLGVWLPLVKC